MRTIPAPRRTTALAILLIAAITVPLALAQNHATGRHSADAGRALQGEFGDHINTPMRIDFPGGTVGEYVAYLNNLLRTNVLVCINGADAVQMDRVKLDAATPGAAVELLTYIRGVDLKGISSGVLAVVGTGGRAIGHHRDRDFDFVALSLQGLGEISSEDFIAACRVAMEVAEIKDLGTLRYHAPTNLI
ncbi:MAG: hypothetical protein EA380_10140, partial [Phycisphaeraceae bacterium]